MANEQNLIPNSERTPEQLREQTRKGGIASGKVRREKASFKRAIKWLAESNIKITHGKIYEMYKDNGVDISQLNPTELATIGLWFGAVGGKQENYKTLMEGNDEIKNIGTTETPDIQFKTIDTTESEKAFWQDEDSD